MRSLLFPFIFFVFCATAFAGSTKEVVIGLASNFSEVSSGSSNPYGGYFRDGVTLALKKSEKKLRDKGISIRTKDFDYGTSDIKVLEATRSAINSNVSAVLGYNYSSNALLAAPLHQEAKLPMLTPSATANRLGTMGRYIHMASFDNAFMGETIAQTAFSTLKARRAVLLPAANCAYCSDLADAFEKEFKKLGGTIVSKIPVLNEDNEFSAVIDRVKNLSFDVILIPNQELIAARMVSAIVKAGINKPLLGADGWGNVGKEFFTVLKGVGFSGYSVSHWHPDLTDAKSVSFIHEYMAAYGKAPNDTSVLAYDSMLLLVEAVIRAKSLTREGIEDSLNGIQTFSAVTGKFVLTPNKAPLKSLVLLKTNGTKFQIVKTIEPKRKRAAL